MNEMERQNSLRKTQDQIAKTSVSNGDQSLLDTIWQELSYVLDPDDDGDIDYDGLRERMVEAAEHFETEHPELATHLREAITILSTGGL